MSAAISFAEHTCWKDEDFRYQRKPIYFRLYTVGEALGQTVATDVLADFGIWYHRDDEYLIYLLAQHAPRIDWGRLYYHRQWDHSGIDIVDPEDDSLVARLEVRQYRGERVEEMDAALGGNVVCLNEWRTSRLTEKLIDSTELLLTEVLRDDT